MRVGIGHDAAVVGPNADLVLKVDQLVEGVHFPEGTPWRLVGRKALCRPLSDLAAIGATPQFALAALAVARRMKDRDVRGILRGIQRTGERYGVTLIGGDLASCREAGVISVTLLGSMEGRRPSLRSGARPGDRIWVTGRLGGSLLGKHLRFEPRLREGRRLAACHRVGGMIDLSDGLALDLWRLCRSSRVGARLFADRIPRSRDALRSSRRSGRSPLEHALFDGEDYELLFTLRPDASRALLRDPALRRVRLFQIGEILAGRSLTLVAPDGKERALSPIGYEHRWS